MKRLKITGCSDALMWYRDKIGQEVPLLRVYSDCYMSREDAGYANIVKLQDAIIVDDHNFSDEQIKLIKRVIDEVAKVDVKSHIYTTYDDGMVKAIKKTICDQIAFELLNET